MTNPKGKGTAPSAQEATPSREDPLMPILRRNYPRIANDILRPLVDLIAICRTTCGGDAQKSEILLLIALRTVAHPAFSRMSFEDIASGQAESYDSLTTNVRSIADSSGMPRETVRRKAAELITAGLVARRGNKLSLRPEASSALTPLREACLRLIASNYRLAAGCLRSPQDEDEAG